MNKKSFEENKRQVREDIAAFLSIWCEKEVNKCEKVL